MQAASNADTLIVQTALSKATSTNEVIVVATDTDVPFEVASQVLHWKQNQVLQPRIQNYDVENVQKTLGRKKNRLLFVHAITGCDTTSSLFGKGKRTAWKMLDVNDVDKITAVFNNPKSKKETIAESGEKFLVKLYGCGNEYPTLDQRRGRIYARTIAKQPVTATFDSATLPPTSCASKQHNFRTFLQVIALNS